MLNESMGTLCNEILFNILFVGKKNIKNDSIVKCELGDKEYLFNIPGEKNQDITAEMIKNGQWYVYTWSD